MFSSSSPIWCFLNALGATFKDPEQARLATKGLYLMEVFPALALPSLDSDSSGDWQDRSTTLIVEKPSAKTTGRV